MQTDPFWLLATGYWLLLSSLRTLLRSPGFALIVILSDELLGRNSGSPRQPNRVSEESHTPRQHPRCSKPPYRGVLFEIRFCT